mgnify:CR=1 FL=1
MAVTATQLKQVISARVSGVGATTSHLIGGTNTITDSVDIAFGVTFKCRHASNNITMHANQGGTPFEINDIKPTFIEPITNGIERSKPPKSATKV